MNIGRAKIARALPVAILGVIVGSHVALGQPVVSERRPNLRPFAASDLAVVPNGAGGLQLVFTATSWNNGAGPLEIRGGEVVPGPTETEEDRQNVYQRVYLSDGGFYERLAGTFEYHPAHAHVHLNDYALYSLQPVNAPGGSHRSGEKTSFCLIDIVKVDTHLEGAPKRPVYVSCQTSLQGISVGWADQYSYKLPGQSIDITGNPSGDYNLSIEVDPRNHLLESNEYDNISCVRLRINGTNPVQILGDCGATPNPGNVTITAVDPTTAAPGSSVLMTITGSGFSDGMAVGFENGSGAAPIATDVQVWDAGTRITTTVSVKNGKIGGDPIWDVRVGPAVLQNGFTVTR